MFSKIKIRKHGELISKPLFIGILAFTGIATLFLTQAATPTAHFEAESSTKSNATAESDTSASGGQYLKFGSGSTAYTFPPTGALWSAGHENTTTDAGLVDKYSLSKWHGGTPSGFAASYHLAKASNGQPVNSGTQSMRLYADTNGSQAGIRMRVENNITGAASGDVTNYMPMEGCYSVWYYVRPGEGARGVGGEGANWNLFQYKQWDPERSTMSLLYFVRVTWQEPEGYYRVSPRTDINLNTGEWDGDVTPTESLPKIGDPRIYEGRWHHMEYCTKRSTTGNGYLRAYLDGVQFLNVEGVYTQVVGWAPNTSRGVQYQWTVNNYMTRGGSEHLPTSSNLYIDDAAVSRTRIGPSGQGF